MTAVPPRVHVADIVPSKWKSASISSSARADSEVADQAKHVSVCGSYSLDVSDTLGETLEAFTIEAFAIEAFATEALAIEAFAIEASAIEASAIDAAHGEGTVKRALDKVAAT